MANVRIIEQPEITTLSGGEFLVTDSQAAGTKKITPANLVAAAGGGSGTGVSDELKTALLQLASKVAYIDDDGQEYYDDLYDALYPSKTLTSITAVYTQSGTVYPSTSLDTLKNDLVVTAHYDDSTSETVTTYTLSGTLTVGTSVVTVSYGGKTTTFNVTVSEQAVVSSISAVYTQSGTVYDTDSLDSLKSDLVVTATYSDSSTETVPSADYTLSGTLVVGTSTITVSYESKTTTFNVTVSDSSSLPTGFTEHDYIRSDGDAYIDTGINEKPGTTTGYWGIFEAHDAGTNAKNLFGYDGTAEGGSSTYRFCMVLSTSNVLNYYGAATGLSSAIGGWDDQAVNDITVEYSSSSNYPSFTIDNVQTTGNKVKTTAHQKTIPPIYLMAKNYQAGGATTADKAVDGSYIKCYGFKIFENSVAVAHFVPAVRDLDSTAGFYDLVRRAFYPSIGTNAFTAGDNT